MGIHNFITVKAKWRERRWSNYNSQEDRRLECPANPGGYTLLMLNSNSGSLQIWRLKTSEKYSDQLLRPTSEQIEM